LVLEGRPRLANLERKIAKRISDLEQAKEGQGQEADHQHRTQGRISVSRPSLAGYKARICHAE
jgi:hypothetical protein